ncbi:MAG: GerMN domain-containing protein [Firmicutes bacterium]|nr:GerMN domain-containing protein [Bacillota bacterium]
MKLFFSKRWDILLMLCAGIAMFGGCSPASPAGALQPTAAAQSAEVAGQAPEIRPHADEYTRDEQTVALYFRMRDESMLAQETRGLIIPRDKQFEQVLIESLIEGPSASSMDLTGLFIPGTKVVEVNVEGQMMTVTLSRTFLGTPVDAPADWNNDAVWRKEVLIRRQLALASIVNTVTEQTACASVQLLVQFNPDYPRGERIARAYLYEDADASLLLTPVSRDEEAILTHYNTAMLILNSFMEKDFTRLYRFVEGRPTEAAFMEEMAGVTRSLVSFTLTPGMVSPGGDRAVIVARLGFIVPGDVIALEAYPLDFVRERGIWKIPYETLLRMLEVV